MIIGITLLTALLLTCATISDTGSGKVSDKAPQTGNASARTGSASTGSGKALTVTDKASTGADKASIRALPGKLRNFIFENKLFKNHPFLKLILFIILGAVLGVAYDLLVIRKYPKKRRKAGYVVTIIVFVIVTTALYSLFNVRLFAKSKVSAYSQTLEQSVKGKYPNARWVRNGIATAEIKNNADIVIADLWTVLPPHTELKVGKKTYDLVSNLFKKDMTKKLKAAGDSGKKAGAYTDKNNILTASSLINGLKRNIMNIVNIIVLVFASIFVIILLIHIIKSLSIVSKEKKART